MNRVVMNAAACVISAAGVLFTGARALAADTLNHAPMSKREMIGQVVGCMKKRMSADRSISYNEAAKVCKLEVKHRESASGALVASDSPAKR
jgi:hypothetical protein